MGGSGLSVVVLGSTTTNGFGADADGQARRVLALDDGTALRDPEGLVAAVENAFEGEPVDLVLDDGSHPPEDSRTAFDALYPRLRPGGRYVISSWNVEQRLLDELAATLGDPGAPGHDEAVAAVAEGLRAGAPVVAGRPSLVRLAVELVLAQASGRAAIESVELGDADLTVVRGPAPLDAAAFRLDGCFTDHLDVLGRQAPAVPAGTAPAAAAHRSRRAPSAPNAPSAPAPPGAGDRPARIETSPTDRYRDCCSVCGWSGWFERGEKPTRECFRCPGCSATVRYQAQADAVLALFGDPGVRTLRELAKRPAFRRLSIYEPGELGPFRPILRSLRRYDRSTYTPGVAPGAVVGGVANQDLERLTYPDRSFDLVLTSDVLEHVRHPDRVWRETFRVLRPGGAHVFSVPGLWPMPPVTTPRVDVSGVEDVHLLEPHHHNGHLVYNDFGTDVLDALRDVGFEASLVRFECPDPVASRACTFVARRPAG